MLTRLIAVSLLASLWPIGPASAASDHESEEPCANTTVTSDLTICLNAIAARSDEELNEVYQEVRAVLGEDDLVRLLAAQRAWLSYRDKTCEASSKLYGTGSARLPAHPRCIYSVTQQRIALLKETYWWRVEKFRT